MKCVSGNICVYSTEWPKYRLDVLGSLYLDVFVSSQIGQSFSWVTVRFCVFICGRHIVCIFISLVQLQWWMHCVKSTRYSRVFNLHYLPLTSVIGVSSILLIRLHWCSGLSVVDSQARWLLAQFLALTQGWELEKIFWNKSQFNR